MVQLLDAISLSGCMVTQRDDTGCIHIDDHQTSKVSILSRIKIVCLNKEFGERSVRCQQLVHFSLLSVEMSFCLPGWLPLELYLRFLTLYHSFFQLLPS